jgi:hypothetical protein
MTQIKISVLCEVHYSLFFHLLDVYIKIISKHVTHII